MHKCLIAILIPLFLNSCGWAVPIVAAGGAAGYVATQDRTTGRIVDDTSSWSRLKNKLAGDSAKRFSNVHVKINEGRTLLTGHVTTREARKEAVNLAWSIDGIKEVINEIEISHAGTATMGNYARDSLITGEIKAELARAKNLNSRNFSIDTHDGKVYIMGVADSKSELNRAIEICKSVRHVKKVISHARIKSLHEKHDHRRAI